MLNHALRFCLATTCLFSAFAMADNLVINDAWVRALPPTVTATAAYMRINNSSDEAIRLVKIETPAAKMAQVHLSSMVGGVMKMQHQSEGLLIPAKQSVELKPGGLHIMLMGIDRSAIGSNVKLSLSFDDGQLIELHAPVKKNAMPTAMKHSHD